MTGKRTYNVSWSSFGIFARDFQEHLLAWRARECWWRPQSKMLRKSQVFCSCNWSTPAQLNLSNTYRTVFIQTPQAFVSHHPVEFCSIEDTKTMRISSGTPRCPFKFFQNCLPSTHHPWPTWMYFSPSVTINAKLSLICELVSGRQRSPYMVQFHSCYSHQNRPAQAIQRAPCP